MTALPAKATMPTKAAHRRRVTPGRVIVYIVLILWALTTIFPFVWVLNNSFKLSELVINDSFTPAWTYQTRTDKYGTTVREQILLDENSQIVYDKLQTDEDGNPLYDDKGWPIYDKKEGKIVYDETSPILVLSPTLANYENAFTNPNVQILNGYKNSLIISGTVTVVVMLLSSMMAYAITRYTFRGKKTLRALIVAALMFPCFSTIVPVYRMIASMGLFNKLPSVMLVQTAGNLAFAATIMIGFIAQLPYELEEAAFIEGAGVFQIFFRIVLPLSKSSLATVGIFTFLWSYNDLFVQMVLLRSKSVMPVSAILREISSQFGTDFGLLSAAVTLVVVPVLIVYIFLQKHIVKGLTAGAVKG